MKPARDVLALDSTVPSASGFKAAKSVGERLRKLRVDRRLTIIELAARSGVSAGMISQIERDSSSPSVKTLQRLGAAFDLSLLGIVRWAGERFSVRHAVLRSAEIGAPPPGGR